MAVYIYSEVTVDRLVRRARKGIVYARIAALALLCFSFCWMVTTKGLRGEHPILRTVPIFAVVILGQSFGKKAKSEKLRRGLTNVRVSLTSADLQVTNASGFTRKLEFHEVTKMEEARIGGSLYLRTKDRYRWLGIPRSLDGYESIQNELEGLGIPLVLRVIPTNLEEWIFVFLFCSTVAANIFIRNITSSILNLIFAILLAGAGLYFIHAGPESQIPKWKALLGCCLPALFASVALVFLLYR